MADEPEDPLSDDNHASTGQADAQAPPAGRATKKKAAAKKASKKAAGKKKVAKKKVASKKVSRKKVTAGAASAQRPAYSTGAELPAGGPERLPLEHKNEEAAVEAVPAAGEGVEAGAAPAQAQTPVTEPAAEPEPDTTIAEAATAASPQVAAQEPTEEKPISMKSTEHTPDGQAPTGGQGTRWLLIVLALLAAALYVKILLPTGQPTGKPAAPAVQPTPTAQSQAAPAASTKPATLRPVPKSQVELIKKVFAPEAQQGGQK